RPSRRCRARRLERESPELRARVVRRLEVDDVSRARQALRGGRGEPGGDVLQEDRSAGGRITPPELTSLLAAGGREEENPAAGEARLRLGAVGTLEDVLHDPGPVGGPVAPPQLAPVHAVVGRDEGGAVPPRRDRVELLEDVDEPRPLRRTVAEPELDLR